MADFENNVHRLAAVRINERDTTIAFNVAIDLVFEVIGLTFDKLSERRQRTLIRPFANHLHDNYRQKLHLVGYSHEDAAREAMEEESDLIETRFKPIGQ